MPEISKARDAVRALSLAGLARRRCIPRSTCVTSASAAPTSKHRRSIESCLSKTQSLPDRQLLLTIGTPAECLMSTYVRHQSLRPEAEASLTLATPFGAFRKDYFSSLTPDSAPLARNPHKYWVPCAAICGKSAAKKHKYWCRAVPRFSLSSGSAK